MTYIELQNAAKDALIDTPTIVANAIPRLVNQAIIELEDRFNFKIMQAEAAFVTSAGSHTMSPSALPTDFKEFRSHPYYIENLGSSKPMDLVTSRELILRRWSTGPTDIGDPHSLVSDTTLEVWPLPDAASDYPDGEYRVTMPYWKYLPALAASGDTNWFTINAPQYIINWVVAEGFAIDWDENRANYWSQRADKEALRAILTGKKQYLSMTDTLVPHLGALEGPDSVR